MKGLINMQISFSDILETLKYSVNFEEFQINYNELIPEITKAKNNSLYEWKKFIKEKNKMKKVFYEKYCKEYQNEYLRKLREAKYIYDIDLTNCIIELEYILNFKNRLIKLQ